WFQLIVLAPRMRARFVDRAGAGKDKPRARCMRFHGGYQVQRSFQISLPDEIGVLGTKDSGQVNDVCYGVHRLSRRWWVKEITFNTCYSGRHLLARTDKRTAIHTSFHQAWQQPRTYQSGYTGYQNSHTSLSVQN